MNRTATFFSASDVSFNPVAVPQFGHFSADGEPILAASYLNPWSRKQSEQATKPASVVSICASYHTGPSAMETELVASQLVQLPNLHRRTLEDDKVLIRSLFM